MLLSPTMQANTWFSSSTLLILPLFAPPRLLPSATRLRSSEKSDVRLLGFPLTLNSLIWSTAWSRGRMAVLARCKSHWWATLTKPSRRIMAAFARTEEKLVYLTGPPTLSTERVLWGTLQLMIFQWEEIPMSTSEWLRHSNIPMCMEKCAQQTGNQDKKPWSLTQRKPIIRKLSVKQNDLCSGCKFIKLLIMHNRDK